ncbi:MAG: hypothetical protein RSC29_03700, partial [Oscillospiraceae bacterium]
IAPCFTAPESGKYRIETNIINRGTRLGNMGRIAIIPTGTTMETPDNCTEFNIVNPSSGEHVPYDSGVINLTQGDKVFLKVHSLNGEHDGVDIWGSHKITKLNPDETVNTVYDLSDMAFTKAEGFKFYTADKDSNNFSAIFSAKPEWIKGGTEFTKGVAAPASSWKDGTVTMQAKPYIGWNNDDKYITVKPTEKDLIFSYKPILNGDFKLDISAFNTKQNGITNSGVLSISKINTNTGEATPLNELSITGVGKLENTVFELKAGETLLIRVNKTDVSGDDEFKMSVQLEKIDKNLNVISTVNDTPFTGTENINVGDTVKLNAIMGNYSQKEITVQLFACFYNKDGKMTKLKAMPNKKIASMEKINEIIAVNIEDDIKGGRIEVYAWEDFNIGRAINNMIIIK